MQAQGKFLYKCNFFQKAFSLMTSNILVKLKYKACVSRERLSRYVQCSHRVCARLRTEPEERWRPVAAPGAGGAKVRRSLSSMPRLAGGNTHTASNKTSTFADMR